MNEHGTQCCYIEIARTPSHCEGESTVVIKERFSDLSKILLTVWSIESSSKWSPQNPANGQCGVTALVVNDFLGGEILKTKTPDGWHYYNKIDGIRCDFTESQFAKNTALPRHSFQSRRSFQ